LSKGASDLFRSFQKGDRTPFVPKKIALSSGSQKFASDDASYRHRSHLDNSASISTCRLCSSWYYWGLPIMPHTAIIMSEECSIWRTDSNQFPRLVPSCSSIVRHM